MSKHKTRVAIQHMLDHAREARDLAQGTSRAELDQHRLLNLSLVRLLEIVGEAARRVPEDVRLRFPDLPWVQIIGLRNRLIHGYDTVDFDILWQILTTDLPLMVVQLEHILAELERTESGE
jgi:uncharacterized protein with HEPN domain